MKLLIIGAVLILSVFAKNCENPLFQARFFKDLGVKVPRMRVAPKTQVSAFFCDSFNGQESCCSQATLITMKQGYEKYESTLKASVESILEKAVAQCDEIDKIPQNTKLAAKFENIRAKVLESMAESADRCQEAALKYTRGMMCMGCSADAEEFIDEDNTVMVDVAHLDELNDACKEFIQQSVSFDKTVESHKETIRAKACKKVTLKLTDSVPNTVNLCIHDSKIAFQHYVMSVAKFIAAKYEFEAGYTFHFKAGKVFVCDKEGCEEEVISAAAALEFKNEITPSKSVVKQNVAPTNRKVVAECNEVCVENRIKSAANGLFFNFDALLTNKAISTEAVTFVAEGYAFRQAAATTTTTTTTGTTGTTATGTTSNSGDATKIQGMADTIKGKLGNTTAQVDVYFSGSSVMKVMLIPLAILGLVMLN